MKQKKFGVIGLGKMGGALSLNALEKGWEVVGYTLGRPSQELIKAGMDCIPDIEHFKSQLQPPRVIFLYIPAGKPVDLLLEKLSRDLETGDIIVDGGNSYWGDSIKRHDRLRRKGISFVDLGTSGGVSGARHGANFMVGGDAEAVSQIDELLKELAVPNGYVYAGPSGAGHFVKLVHNGIEFGMLQAIGEGVELLRHWQLAELPIEDILGCWSNGSVIRSWLIELLAQAYKQEKNDENIPSFVEDTGEVNWLVSDALHMEVPIPVITQSVIQLFASREKSKHWARAISRMRHEFGGHPFGPSEPIAEERKHGRLTDYYLKEVNE